jgi:glutamate carboxypeptidase
MEADERLVATAQAAARSVGLEVGAAVTGGVGDANLCAPTPTLDGLGPVGGADHSDAEWLDLTSVGPRISLLVALINSLQEMR